VTDRPQPRRHTNRLIEENSPYLLQHAHNPVDWHPWGEEALARAKAEDKPIFLSVGYAACHWCHVMERESFEDEETARLLNDHFVSIKVDREQRPDIDQIYMSFTMAMTGGGGWPMSVFLTPDLKPFFAGTYFPPEDTQGRPGFKHVLREIAAAYRESKAQLLESSEAIFGQIAGYLRSSPEPTLLTPELVHKVARTLMGAYDSRFGGFGHAPKFPHGVELSFLLRQYKATGDLSLRAAVEKTLGAMAEGGIYDHLGGGFARYSTDERWLVPHFERMLYDNALLVPVYSEAYRITRDRRCRTVVVETLDWVLREMTAPCGGFYSAVDADSEGEEGKFYLWTKEEIDRVLGDRAELFCRYYNVTAAGNFEGKNILHLSAESEGVRRESGGEFEAFLAGCRRDLSEVRSRRPRPQVDDKILTSWNGLMISALCHGYQITEEVRFLAAAVQAAAFIRDELFHRGSLTHAYRDGRRSEGEFLEDYAYLVHGLLDLSETDTAGARGWLEFADRLAGRAIGLFGDDQGRFFLRPADAGGLILRPREETDASLPAPGSILMHALLKLNRLTGNRAYLQTAQQALRAVSGLLDKYPSGMAAAAIALQYYAGDKIEIVIVGRGRTRDDMLRAVYDHFLPNRVVALSDTGAEPLPLFEGRGVANGETRAYLCRNSVCRLPVTTAADLAAQLAAL